MMRNRVLSLLVLGVVATTSAAQPQGSAPGNYDPNVEKSYDGVVTSVNAVLAVGDCVVES